jgi:predicted phage terminase large subunit-like protein
MTLDVPIHPVQRAFLQSNALFRGFVGGVGSGKSWIGSCDLILRAKPGRLYLVVAPTYVMLSDATIRSFVYVASQWMGGDLLLDPSEVKRSPPSIRLRTGAEIIFRSADDPERLRGPNISGIWLDEASLMDEEAFTIAIGRLREAGEQGWLTATFTPKGKLHWTYEVFGEAKPDTALFHCRTKDNPFLPASFEATTRRQYTSALAAQELEGLFTDAAGTLFRRAWFQVVEALPRLTRRVRAWDLAATPKDEKAADDPDWTAGVLMGADGLGTYFVEDVRRIRGTPKQVKDLVRATANEDGRATAVWVEREGGASGVIVGDDFLDLLAGYNYHSEHPTGPKAERARPLAAQAEGGAVKLLRGGWNRDFLNEIEAFPFGKHDDQVDAAALAFAKLALARGYFGDTSASLSDDEPVFVPHAKG